MCCTVLIGIAETALSLSLRHIFFNSELRRNQYVVITASPNQWSCIVVPIVLTMAYGHWLINERLKVVLEMAFSLSRADTNG